MDLSTYALSLFGEDLKLSDVFLVILGAEGLGMDGGVIVIDKHPDRWSETCPNPGTKLSLRASGSDSNRWTGPVAASSSERFMSQSSAEIGFGMVHSREKETRCTSIHPSESIATSP